jgi:signal transduction histidine kinase
MDFVKTTRVSILAKLIVPFVLLAALVLLVLLPVTGRLLAGQVEEEADRQLETTAGTVGALLENAEQQALLTASFVASANTLRVAAGVENTTFIGDYLSAERDILNLQELSYYSADYQPGDAPIYFGGPVAAGRFRPNVEVSSVREELIVAVLESRQPSSALLLTPQSAQILGAAPVFGTREMTAPRGVLLSAQFIDDDFLSSIGDTVNADVALVRDNAVVVSTIEPESGYELLLQGQFRDLGGSIGSTNLVYTNAEGEQVRERLLAAPLVIDGRTVGSVLVSQPVSDLFAVGRNLQLVMAGLGVLVVLGSTGFGAAVVLSMARPLLALSNSAERMAEGDLNARVEPIETFPDEITDLTYSFNSMAERLQALVENLDEQVKERTAALQEANVQLSLARDEALKANKTKSAFLATMSHELRTPLNAIIGYSQMMSSGMAGDLNAKQSDYVERVLRNGKQLLTLINDILDLSKIEAGRVEILHQPFDTREWAAGLDAQVRGLAEQKGIGFKVEVADDLPPVLMGDSDRLNQVAINLLSNAIKFTHEGHIALRVTVPTEEKWCISVEDTGIGIPSHLKEVIFEEFRQVDERPSREYGGTGLGLAIVRNLVVSMGGTITVDSDVGEGSLFTVTLPLEKTQTPLVKEA